MFVFSYIVVDFEFLWGFYLFGGLLRWWWYLVGNLGVRSFSYGLVFDYFFFSSFYFGGNLLLCILSKLVCFFFVIIFGFL